MAVQNVRAITLWSGRGREADKIVSFFTRERGRLTVRATSAAKAAARFVAITEPFAESDVALVFSRDRQVGKLVGGRLLRSFPGLRQQVARTTAGAWMCELLQRLTPLEQPSPEKYDLLADALETAEHASEFWFLRLGFALRLLDLVGLSLWGEEPWKIYSEESPEAALFLKEGPLGRLGRSRERDERLISVEQLISRTVADHLNRPLAVNRFRQMTGVEI